jgi:hypothetical protein
MVATQKIQVGMIHARKTAIVTAHDDQFTIVIDGETAAVVPRTHHQGSPRGSGTVRRSALAHLGGDGESGYVTIS